MLISSMDQLNYYSMPKDGYLEIDTSSPNGYSMDQQTLDDEGSPTYMNEENSPKNGTKSSLYKTELCKRFSEFGSCRYGTKCQFAHGLAELRHVLRHPKYKTTKCKSYWGSGHCPYGSRCRFIHEEAESMTQPQFSPQSAMGGGMNGGMFFQDQQLPGLATSLDGASHASMASNSYLYGARGIAPSNDDHVLPGASYQKEYSLLGSFDKDVATPWGMGSRGATYNGSVAATATGVVSTEPPVYPDLQDAIDSLMRFSLAPTESEAAGAGSANGAMASSAPLGTITTTPVDSRLTAAGVAGDAAAKTKKDFSLQSDELWTDFPSLSTTSSSDFGDKQWPTGLSLSLEGTGLFSSSTSTSTTSVSTTSVDNKQPELSPTTASSAANKKDETSPRLSIFERFH